MLIDLAFSVSARLGVLMFLRLVVDPPSKGASWNIFKVG